MALIIGLTGSIASGKSTVSRMFDEFNIPVVDADKIAKEIVNPGEKAYDKIIQVFGNEMLLEDKMLDRKKLGAIIFADEEKRTQLNNIVHPIIRQEMIKLKNAYIRLGSKCVVLDIPLLFESNLTNFVDKIIVVYVDEEVQLQRLMKRDGSTTEEAKQRISSQISLKEKVTLSDAVINNNGTKQQSYEQLEKLLKEWHVI